MARDRDRRDSLRQIIEDLENNAYIQPPPTTAGPVVLTAADRLRDAEAQLAALERRLRPTHPDYVRAKKSVEELRRLAEDEAAAAPVGASSDQPLTMVERLRRTRLNDANREMAAIEKGLEAKVKVETSLREALTQYQKRIEATPTSESELIELTRDYGTLQGMYQSLLSKKQDSQISANLERRQIGEQFRILDPARLPPRPFTPNRPRFYAGGLIGGLALGLVFAGLLEYLDKKLRSEDDIRVALSLPVLAAIPFVEEDALIRRRRLLALSGMVAVAVVGAAALAAWRLLR